MHKERKDAAFYPYPIRFFLRHFYYYFPHLLTFSLQSTKPAGGKTTWVDAAWHGSGGLLFYTQFFRYGSHHQDLVHEAQLFGYLFLTHFFLSLRTRVHRLFLLAKPKAHGAFVYYPYHHVFNGLHQ